ncbi:hypothetical protein ASE59_04810 [Sphingomonas sp. Leaf10]|nr:hypothetical protein ASE59_04810 [Sphingomonas sp. Leaf10]
MIAKVGQGQAGQHLRPTVTATFRPTEPATNRTKLYERNFPRCRELGLSNQNRENPMTRFALAAAAAFALTACGSQTPQQQQAEQLRDQADAEGDAIEAAAENQTAQMKVEAEGLLNQAQQAGGYDAERLKVRADAMRDEAKLVEQQAEARAKAVRDAGEANASAALAK